MNNTDEFVPLREHTKLIADLKFAMEQLEDCRRERDELKGRYVERGEELLFFRRRESRRIRLRTKRVRKLCFEKFKNV
jgi:hypothetical protein